MMQLICRDEQVKGSTIWGQRDREKVDGTKRDSGMSAHPVQVKSFRPSPPLLDNERLEQCSPIWGHGHP